MYKLSALKNKLRIITYPMPHSHGVTSGIFVNVGSRFETDKQAGISHFAEHMFYKGTKKRPTPADISRAIEAVGGYTNAATSQDYTFFYNRVPARHVHFALDFLADIINHSLFDQAAIKREKSVILEELNMYLDTPTRYIYDLIMKTVWPDNSLGRDIIGRRASLAAVTRASFMPYLRNTYQPQNMVLAVAGQVSHAEVVQDAKKYFARNKNGRLLKFKKVITGQTKARVLIHSKTTDQAHLCLAVPALPRGHQLENPLALLETILGGGMSSRLFLNIREKRGLCYYINSFSEKFADTGIFGISAGLNTGKIQEAIKAILAELDLISRVKVSQAELNKAKEYLSGNIRLQLDSTENMAIYYGSQALFYQRIKTPEQRIKELLQVKENDIMALARKLFQKNRFNLAVIGPFKQSADKKFLKLLN
ncbi:hypothetical protein A2V95_01475 [Candidatus Kuenenbacteria bacterium RBG_16_41_7]|uniref:Peptidase M16 n=2 Tax=Candidatus Kueneniibacteriota TaxID=1752740 RepID=A0A1F6FLT9_9BACT|nr:MAG: hypothetical protein A3B87_01620 [Candidatus Kuenenbacteria bacterium RIFCSPHIGHO2_02_FULL_39_13]OGG95846.1 MAG: hypothetical protein A2V95_01475 [Candidatus Kuenenbacteria bacterium RBG_16_41_7]